MITVMKGEAGVQGRFVNHTEPPRTTVTKGEAWLQASEFGVVGPIRTPSIHCDLLLGFPRRLVVAHKIGLPCAMS